MSPSSSRAGLGVWPRLEGGVATRPNPGSDWPTRAVGVGKQSSHQHRATFIGLPAHDGSAYVDMMCRDLHQLRSGAIWHHPQERYILHDPSISVDTSFSGPP